MAFGNFMNQAVTLKTRSGYDQYGKEKQNTGVILYGRFEEVAKTRLKPDGSVEAIDGRLFLGSDTIVNQGDHFVIAGIDYRAVRVNSVIVGNGGLHHQEIEVIKWTS